VVRPRAAVFFLDPNEFRVKSRVSRAGGLGRPTIQEHTNVTKTFAAMFVAVALAFASTASAAAPAGPIKLPAKPGDVTFDHAKHAGAQGLKCTTCHATEAGGPIEGFGKTANKDKAHATCHECHKKLAKGPQKCGDCHKKA